MNARGSFTTFMAFFVGLPAGLGLLLLVEQGYIPIDPAAYEYIKHPVEMAEFVMFCCALGALTGKLLTGLHERLAMWRRLLPAWDGQPQPVTAAKALKTQIDQQPGRVQRTYLGRRVAAILDFVESRGAANDLDDQIRSLSDGDIMSVESSYSLLRLITWAIPILGFLGTVLGITGAIQNVSPESLDKGLEGVTSGLATAFNATALALSLTMVLMFLSSMIEKLEQGVLERVDHYVDVHLTHRFERNGAESGKFVEVLRQNSQILVRATELLVEKQASIWAKSMEKADRHWNDTGKQQQEQISDALVEALDRTLASHKESLAATEKSLLARSQETFGVIVERSQSIFEGLSALASVLRETGRQHQAVLSELSEKIAGQTQALTKLQEGEVQLLRLQEMLQQNLNTVASTGTVEQAVHSLTAAIHLLTTRTPTVGQLPSAPRIANRAA